jgi:hypothetical protein
VKAETGFDLVGVARPSGRVLGGRTLSFLLE